MITKETAKTGILFIIFALCLVISSSAVQYSETAKAKQEEPKKESSILYLVDGNETTAKEVDKLKMEDIAKMEYVKDKEKIRKYTDKDVKTVAIITMKKKEQGNEKEQIAHEEIEVEVAEWWNDSLTTRPMHD